MNAVPNPNEPADQPAINGPRTNPRSPDESEHADRRPLELLGRDVGEHRRGRDARIGACNAERTEHHDEPERCRHLPQQGGRERKSGERGDQHRATAAPVARPARRIERDELGRGRDPEREPDARDAQADVAARPEQRDQRLEDRADDPQVDAVHDQHRDERPVPREAPDPAATRLRLVSLRVVERLPEHDGRDQTRARVDVQRAREPEPAGHQTAERPTRDEADVERRVVHAHHAAGAFGRDRAEQERQQRSEEQRRSDPAERAEDHEQRERRRETGGDRRQADPHRADGRHRAFAVPVDEAPDERVGDETRERERRDQQPDRVVADPEAAGVVRQDRRQDAEPEHDHEGPEHRRSDLGDAEHLADAQVLLAHAAQCREVDSGRARRRLLR